MGRVSYDKLLDSEMQAVMEVEFRSRGLEVLDYSVVLLVGDEEARETVRLYDAAHGFNELHRYTRRDGKQPGIQFHGGNLGEGMRTAR
ncbi:MAG: hypothetical protein ACTHN3_01875 [Solirubrobacterales bacterium]